MAIVSKIDFALPLDLFNGQYLETWQNKQRKIDKARAQISLESLFGKKKARIAWGVVRAVLRAPRVLSGVCGCSR